jgi:hypothetical protein
MSNYYPEAPLSGAIPSSGGVAPEVAQLAKLSDRQKGGSTVPTELSVPERVLLFCLASGTEWAHAGVTGATATAMLVRGLVERDASGRLELTPHGRATLDALLKRADLT